jgi:chemotaxis protein histidine kinase CheA
MSKAQAQYKIAFNEHSVHESLKGLRGLVAELSEEVVKEAREYDEYDSLPRLEPVLEFVGALLASADPALVTPAMLDGLDAQIQQISTALTPLKDSKEFEQLSNIQTGIDALLNGAVQVAPAIGVWAQTDGKKAAAQLGDAATEKTRQLQDQASALQGQLNQLREQAEQASGSVKTTAEERIGELQTQLNALKEEGEAESAKVQGAIDNFGAQFEASQKERAEQAEQAIKESKEAAADALKSDQESAEKTIADLVTRTDEIMALLEEKKQEAIEMVDAEATSSTAGAFKEEAEEQRKQADQWRRFALIGGVITILVALAAIVLAVAEIGDGPSMTIAKVTAVTLLLGIAGYAAGQSGQHRQREQRARRLYMQMVAFKPFSEPLPDPEKKEVRKEFIERMFVGDPREDHKDGEVKLSDENLSFIARLLDLPRPSSGSASSN